MSSVLCPSKYKLTTFTVAPKQFQIAVTKEKRLIAACI